MKTNAFPNKNIVMFEEIIDEISKVYNDESLSFISVLERIREILWDYSVESKDYYSLFESLDKNSFNDYLYKHMKVKNVDLKNAESFFNDVYSFLSGFSDLDDRYFSDVYYDTAKPKISSNDISLQQSDIEKADEFISRAILYCAYYMGKVFMSDDFFLGKYTDEEVYNYYGKAYGELFRGNDVINPQLIVKFLSSFEYQMRELFKGKVSKEQYIQVLGNTDTSFKETTLGKEVDYGLGVPEDGILLMSFDNRSDSLVGSVMRQVGIEGVFSKQINKSLFCLCNGNIYKHSMNNGQKHLVASVVTDEALNELKREVMVMLDSLSSGYEEGTTRGRH